MSKLVRGDVNQENAYSGYILAGDFVFLNFCVGNIGKSVEDQINGAFDNMEERLRELNLTFDDVVKIDVLFRDPWNIPVLEEIIKKRFTGGYPTRTTFSSNFAHVGGPHGLEVQINGIAYAGR